MFTDVSVAYNLSTISVLNLCTLMTGRIQSTTLPAHRQSVSEISTAGAFLHSDWQANQYSVNSSSTCQSCQSSEEQTKSPRVLNRRADFTPCDLCGVKSGHWGHKKSLTDHMVLMKDVRTVWNLHEILQVLSGCLLGVIVINWTQYCEVLQRCQASVCCLSKRPGW